MIFRYGSKYGSKDINIEQYNTKQEKDILIMLMQTINHVHFNILDEAMKILNYEDELIKTLTDYEKRIILLKCRELSVGDDISFNFKCNSCNSVNNSIARVDDFFTNNVYTNRGPLKFKKFKIVESYIDLDREDTNIETYLKNLDGSPVDEDVLDNMDSMEYENIYDEIKNNTIKFKSKITGICSSCRNKIPINLSDRLIVENMSEDSIQSIYKTYSDLIYFGSYSKKDIDSLIPFERTIFVGMLNATKKELS